MKISKASLTACLFVVSMGAISPAASYAQEKAANASATEKQSATPSSKEVIERHLKEIGGVDKLKSITSIVATGTVSIPQAGINGRVELYQSGKPGEAKALMKVSLPGIGDQSSGMNGDVIWENSQVTGPEILSGERAAQMKLQMAMMPLMRYSEFFDTIEVTGTENFDGQPCYVLKAVKGKSKPVITYFSTKTGLEVGGRMHAATPVGEMELVTTIADYKDTDGVKIPHLVTVKLPNGMSQEVKFESYKLNTAIADDILAVPAEVAKLKK